MYAPFTWGVGDYPKRRMSLLVTDSLAPSVEYEAALQHCDTTTPLREAITIKDGLK